MLTERHLGFPVVDEAQHLRGIITLAQLEEQLPTAHVRELMRSSVPTVSPWVDAVEAFHLMSRKGSGRVVVLTDRKVVGIITKADLLRLMQLRASGQDVAWLPSSYSLPATAPK